MGGPSGVALNDAVRSVAGVSREIWEAFPCAMVVHHPTGRVLYANDKAHQMTGATSNAGGARWSLLPRGSRLIKPDGTPATRLAPLVRRSGRPVLNVPMGFRHPNGDVMWQAASCVPILDARGLAYQVTSVVEVGEWHAIHQIAHSMWDELLQAVLGVALVLDCQLNRQPEADVGREQVKWAVETLRTSARQARAAIGEAGLLPGGPGYLPPASKRDQCSGAR